MNQEKKLTRSQFERNEIKSYRWALQWYTLLLQRFVFAKFGKTIFEWFFFGCQGSERRKTGSAANCSLKLKKLVVPPFSLYLSFSDKMGVVRGWYSFGQHLWPKSVRLFEKYRQEKMMKIIHDYFRFVYRNWSVMKSVCSRKCVLEARRLLDSTLTNRESSGFV